jgi:hypothetical protein
MVTAPIEELYEFEVAEPESPKMSRVLPLLENDNENKQFVVICTGTVLPLVKVAGEGVHPLTVTVAPEAELAMVTVILTVCCCAWVEEAARVRIMTTIASTRSMKTGVFIVRDPPTCGAHRGALAQLY